MAIEVQDPAHPGEIVYHEVVEPLGLTVTEAVRILGVGRPALSALLNGRAALSPEMAIRIEKAFGPRADHLMRIQLAHDMAKARQREHEIRVRRYQPATS